MHLINWSSVSVSTSIKAEILTVCWSGAFRCVCQGGKTSAVILQKQLLLPINLGKVWSPSFYRERLFTSGKKSRLFSIFPGVDVPASWSQGQTVRCSEKLQTNPRATSQTLRASVSMLNVKVHDRSIGEKLATCPGCALPLAQWQLG